MKNTISFKQLSLLFLSVTLISCSGDDDGDDGGRTTDPLIGTWNITLFVGEVDETAITITFNSNGTMLDRQVPIDPPNCVFSCSGTWSNSSPNTDFNSLTQRYTFDFDASICNPNNICEDDSRMEYNSEPSTGNLTFSSDFNSFTFNGNTYRRQ